MDYVLAYTLIFQLMARTAPRPPGRTDGYIDAAPAYAARRWLLRRLHRSPDCAAPRSPGAAASP